MPDKKLVIYTDLDGTLLDARDYSFRPAAGTLTLLEKLGVPVVICTSKTRAEILRIRQKTGNRHPFISENGGGVYLPDGYFTLPVDLGESSGGYTVISLGAPYAALRDALGALKGMGFGIRGFGDMAAEEVADHTGMTLEEARLAKAREFDEPFIFTGPGGMPSGLTEEIERLGLHYTRGRFWHLMGASDKGAAVRLTTGFYAREFGAVVTAALGDSPNDIPMLLEADYAFLVGAPDGTHDPDVRLDKVALVDGAGPEGWSAAVMGLLKNLRLV